MTHQRPIRTLALALLAVSALPAAAADSMSADVFEDYVEGRTLTYHDGGVAYGIEQYLPGRKVRWAYIGDQCWDGYWYEENANICFVYEGSPEPKCWKFSDDGGKLSAVFMGDGNGRELYEVTNSPDPLTCLGPDVGV